MILAEEEAKTKVCVETLRPAITEATSSPLGGSHWVHAPQSCIGSACMAWRWANDANGEASYRRTPVKDAAGHFDNAPMGYCGKAGAP